MTDDDSVDRVPFVRRGCPVRAAVPARAAVSSSRPSPEPARRVVIGPGATGARRRRANRRACRGVVSTEIESEPATDDVRAPRARARRGARRCRRRGPPAVTPGRRGRDRPRRHRRRPAHPGARQRAALAATASCRPSCSRLAARSDAARARRGPEWRRPPSRWPPHRPRPGHHGAAADPIAPGPASAPMRRAPTSRPRPPGPARPGSDLGIAVDRRRCGRRSRDRGAASPGDRREPDTRGGRPSDLDGCGALTRGRRPAPSRWRRPAFVLPWAATVIGGDRHRDYFDRWGLAGPGTSSSSSGCWPSSLWPCCATRIPAVARVGAAGLVGGALLLGLVWPYLFGVLGLGRRGLRQRRRGGPPLAAGVLALAVARHATPITTV